MAISDEITRLTNAKAAIKTAIEGKGVTVPSSTLLDGYAALISSIPTGGGSTNEISYPAWIKNGDTHLWLDIRNTYQLKQQLCLRMIGTVDWGDGTAAQSVNVTAYTTLTHTYATPGKYRIDLHPTSGTFYLGRGTHSSNVMGARSGRGDITVALYQAEIGTSRITSLTASVFYYCRGLERVYVPKTIVAVGGDYIFAFCSSLEEVEFQDSSTITTTNGPYAIFYSDTVLQDIHSYLPPAQTTMRESTYRGCVCLTEITIPATVTTINAYAINGCTSLKVLRCLPTAPPTVANANAFTSLPTTCRIEVPSASLATYKAANIWSTYASQMVGV